MARGPVGYASLNGVFSAPLTAAAAIAPTVGVALASGLGSYPALFLVLTATGMVSAALTMPTRPPAENLAVTETPAT
jgi:cyanate permease